MAHDAALVSRIAAEQIPNSGTELSVLDACRLIAIATPTATHLGYLQALQHKAVLCEKPLGMTPDNQAAFAGLPSERLYVSYPFAFLQTAQELTARHPSRQSGDTATDKPSRRRQPALPQEPGRVVRRGCGPSILAALYAV